MVKKFTDSLVLREFSGPMRSWLNSLNLFPAKYRLLHVLRMILVGFSMDLRVASLHLTVRDWSPEGLTDLPGDRSLQAA